MQKILITDDDEFLLGLYRVAFRALPDVSITYARSAEEGRAMLAQASWDLAVLDINLGQQGGEGLELLEGVCRESLAAHILMMSTMDDDGTKARCQRADGFVAKDDSFIPSLKAAVARVLDLGKKSPAAA